MANKLKVDQLRTQLAQRGLDTTGTKPILVQRLESALQSETKDTQSTNATEDGASVGNKRQRGEPQIGDYDSSLQDSKIKAVERFREMGIRQLREEASLRGVLTSGSKKELLERLCADGDSNKEPEEVPKDIEVNGDDLNLQDSKVKAVERFREMGIRQLREEASLRGFLTSGSKKELLERLCADEESKKESEEFHKEKEVVNGSAKEKLVTVTKKGGVVLDQWLPEHIKAQYHVLQLGQEIYDAMLNQTNVGDNNNKFYVIQALESDDGRTYMVYNRWGRVGIKGQDKLHGPYTSCDSAVQEFEMKFHAKTKNQWADRKKCICHPKCYTWLEMDYIETEKESVAQSQAPEKLTDSIQPRETQLESRIAKFISLICNISMMKQQMLEIGYNAEKLPLGKLSKSTILKGYDVLKRISDVINQPNGKILEQLSGEFYTVIPHDFGFKKMREFIIDTPSKLKGKLQMVEALGEIEVATKLLKDDLEAQEDPLYSHYKRLRCELMPLDVDSEEFHMIERYTQNTHAKTHSNYTVDILQVFRVSREVENEQYRKFCNAKNRMLLWHGSRLSNWTGILSQGLRIAPPEAPVTGYMFGKGVYFADMFSKSANYCYSSHTSRSGVLLLCEVALGEMSELLTAKYDADQLPKGKLSTKGVGATAPDPSEFKSLDDGVIVPLGKPKEQSGPKGSLLYNEYIVYNPDQIRMRYIVQVNFNFKR